MKTTTLLFCLVLAACGQSGDLYVPKDPAAQPPPPADEAAEKKKEEQP
jgi:predicted small lipoprotein YifL